MMLLKYFILFICMTSFKLYFCERRLGEGRESVFGKKFVVYFVKSPYSKVNYDAWLCGGALVTAQKILTSAACLVEMEHIYAIAGYKKYVNGDQIDKDPCTRLRKQKVVKIYTTQDYAISSTNPAVWTKRDIGIAMVEKPYDFSDFSYRLDCSYEPQIIEINFDKKYEHLRSECMIYSWGTIKARDPNESDVDDTNLQLLQEGSSTILDIEECLQVQGNMYLKDLLSNEYVLCTWWGGSLYGDGMDDTPNIRNTDGCARRYSLNQDVNNDTCLDDGFDFRRSDAKVIDETEQLNKGKKRVKRSWGTTLCQNDHGSPLVRWVGTKEVVVGIAINGFYGDNYECRGPYLFTSTAQTAHIIKCMMTTTQEQREECNTHIKQASDTVKEIVISWPEDEVVPKYLRQGNDELPLQIRPTLDGKDDIGIGDTLEGLHDEGEGQVQSQINQNRAQHHGLSDTPELYELLNLRKQPQVGEQSQQYGYEQIHEQPRKNVEEREDSNRELQAKLTNNYNKQMDTYNSPQMHASNIPQVNSYQQPQIDSHNSPQMDSYMEPQVNTYNSPQKDFLNSPEVSSYKQPQVDSYDSPQMGSDPQPQASFDASSQVVSNKQFRQQDSHQLPQIDTYSVHQMVSYTEPQVDPYNFPQMDSFKGTQGNPYHKPQEASHRQHQIDFYNSSPVGSHKQPQEASHPFPQINSYSAPQEDSYDNLQKDFYRQSRIDSYDSSHMDSYKEPQINFYQEHPSYNQPQIHPGQPKFLDTDSHSSFQTQSFLHPQLETGKQPEEDIFSQYQSDARPLNSPLEHPVVEVQKPENIFSFQPKTKSFKLPIVESYKQSKIEPYNQEYSESFKSFSEHLTSILDGPFDAPQSRQSDSSPEELSPHSQSASMQEQTQPANVIRERQSDPLIRPTFHLTQDDTQSFEQTYPSQPHAPAAIEESTVNPEKPLHDLYKSLRDPNDMPRNQEFEAKHQQSKEQPAEPHFEQPLERTEEQFDNVTKTAYAQSHTIPQQETERSEAKPQDQTEEEEDDVQVRPQMPLDYNY